MTASRLSSSRIRSAVTAAIVLGVAAAGCATPTRTAAPAAAPPPEAVLTPVLGSVLYPPVPVLGSDDRTHLVYELILTNYTGADATVNEVDVLDAASGTAVAHLDAAQVATRMLPTGQKDYASTLAKGQNGVVFLHVTLDAGAPVPDRLVQEVSVTLASAPAGSPPTVERIGATAVDARTLPVLGPPLIGTGYIAADGCCDAVRHTRALLPINGEPFLAQRYAIDYEQVDADNRIFVGTPTDPASYAIFGDQAIAVADATVAVVLDGLPEQVPGTFPANIPIAEADGNSVVLDLGNGFFANYAHMQPGSVRVKVGDRVRRGDVLGLVGNSGNSVAPHLHFHVMDTASPLAAQGLPYLIDSFTITGQVASTADFDRSEGTGIPLVLVAGVTPTEHRDQMVLDQALVTFAGS